MAFRLNSMVEYQALVARMKSKDAPPMPCEAPKESKFHSVITEALGIKFHSKKEARYFLELVCRQKAGDVLYFLRQVPFDLPGNVKYRIDFMEVHRDGSIHWIDVKGVKTPMFIMKRKQVEALYPVKIITS